MTGRNKRVNEHLANRFLWWPGLFILSFFIGCESYEIVIDELSQREANEVLVLLRDQEIDADKIGQIVKKNTSYQIQVRKKQAKDALRILVHNQIPKIHRAGLKEVYPPGSSGIIPTKSDELARMMMAMQGEIEELLKIIPGIADARVVISYEPPLDYNKAVVKKTASVALIYHPPESNLLPISEPEVKNLIAASISGLLPEDVTVIERNLPPMGNPSSKANDGPQAAITTISSNVEESPMLSPRYLMALTMIALMIAAYAVLRIFWQRRQSST